MRYFVIRGFGTKQDSDGNRFNFDEVDRLLIAPALAQCGFEGGTTGQIADSGSIHEDMFALILEADVVLCDITVHNANVFYELGVRHALRKKRTVLIKGEPSADKTPFDIGGFRYLGYAAADPAATVPALVQALRQGQASERETDSPVFLYLPRLPEAEPSEVSVAPRHFIEAVELASATQDAAQLQQLATQARSLRYPWAGLALVARAQSRIKATAAARASWELLRHVNALALEAELALGNVYERLSRAEQGSAKVELLTRSNQALRAALATPGIDEKQQAEALSQQARNLKTLWRLEWEGHRDPAARREHALHPLALQSWEGYRKAFELDLNGYYSGLAALQMGRLLGWLAHEPGWADLHDAPEAAERAAGEIERQCASLAQVVDASIRRALAVEHGDRRMWAQISRADWLFLTEPEPALGAASRRVNQAYRSAIPPDHRFAHDAATNQLAMCLALGFRPGMAQGALQTLAQASQEPATPPTPP